MTDNPLLTISIAIWFIITLIKGFDFNFTGKWLKSALLSKIFPQYQESVRELTQEERQLIVRLAEDINLLIYRVVAIAPLFIIAILANFFALIALLLFPINNLGSISISLFFMIIFYWFSNIVTKNIDIIARARELYIEDREINAEISPDFDETEYLLSSPINASRLAQSIEEVEKGQCVSVDFK